MKYYVTILFSLLCINSVSAQNNIAAGEYYIGTDPGEGNGTSISASDGSFNSSSESVSFDINTTGFSYGAHWIFVRFQNDVGSWGNPEGIMVIIKNPNEGSAEFVEKAE